MRFLLNIQCASRQVKYLPPVAHSNSEVNNISGTVKTWGQQCSNNCGCAVRFEASINAKEKNKIVKASYVAKRVLTKSSSSVDGLFPILRPIRTFHRDEKIMVKDCHCKTLHQLAREIVVMLPKLNLDQAQNQLEYEGLRSSVAFRFTVLNRLNLLSKSDELDINNIPEGKCFDLVEEALIACLQGRIPKSRKEISIPHSKTINYSDPFEYDKVKMKSRVLDPLRFANAAKMRANRISQTVNESSEFNMPPFHLLREEDAQMNTLTQIQNDITTNSEKTKHLMDWISYLDDRDVQT